MTTLFHLRPRAVSSTVGTWNQSSPNDWGNVSDNSDATSVKRTDLSKTSGAYKGYLLNSISTGSLLGGTDGLAFQSQSYVRHRAVARCVLPNGASAQVALKDSTGALTSTGLAMMGNAATAAAGTTTYNGNWANTVGGVRPYANANTALPNGLSLDTLVAEIGDLKKSGNAANYPTWYDVWVEVEVTSQPLVTSPAPVSTVNAVYPNIGYTYSDGDGYSQTAVQCFVMPTSVYTANSTNLIAFLESNSPLITQAVEASTAALTGAAANVQMTPGVSSYYSWYNDAYVSHTNQPLAVGTSYTAVVRAIKTDVMGYRVANYPKATSSFSVTLAAPPPPTLTTTWDATNQKVDGTVTALVNMLSDLEANPEGANLQTTNIAYTLVTANANASLSYSTTVGGAVAANGGLGQPSSGSAALRASLTASNSQSTLALQGTLHRIYGDGSASFTAAAYVRGSVSTPTANMAVSFYDGDGTFISTAAGAASALSASAWAQRTVNGTIPSNAVYAQAVIQFASIPTATAIALYVDAVHLYPVPVGTANSTTWTVGGFADVTYGIQNDSLVTPSGTYASSFGTYVAVQQAKTVAYGELTGMTAYQSPSTIEDGIGVNQSFTFTDYQTARTRSSVNYRVTQTLGLRNGMGVTSYVVQQVVLATTITPDTSWWIKAIRSPSLNAKGLRVQQGLSSEIQEQQGVFQPLGRTLPVVIASGISGVNDSVRIVTTTDAEWAALLPLLQHQGILLIQEPQTLGGGTLAPRQKWVRITERSWTTSGTPGSPVRDVSVTWTQVAQS